MKKNKVKDLIKRLGEQEKDLLDKEIFSPYFLHSSMVYAKIEGILYKFKIPPRPQMGFGIFKPVDYKNAKYIREAEPELVQEYLHAFPEVRAILVFQTDTWFGYPVNISAYERIGFKGLSPCYCTEGVAQFDYVVCAFDGTNLWFLDLDNRADVEKIERLRTGLSFQNISRKAFTPEDNRAFDIARMKKREQELLTIEGRLRYQLELLGAELISYRELGTRLEVQWQKQAGRIYSTIIHKDDFSLVSAGICLSGEDRKFDMASLVGVISEGERNNVIAIIGNDEYD